MNLHNVNAVETVEVNGVHMEKTMYVRVRMAIDSAIASMKSGVTTCTRGISTAMARVGQWSIVVKFTNSSAAICIKKGTDVVYSACTDACKSVWAWLKSLFTKAPAPAVA